MRNEMRSEQSEGSPLRNFKEISRTQSRKSFGFLGAVKAGKKTILFAILIIAGLFAVTARGNTYESYNELSYSGDAKLGFIIVAAVDENDTPADENQRAWDDVWDATAKAPKTGWIAIPNQITFPCLSFFAHGHDANDPNVGTFDVNCMVARPFGGAKKVLAGGVTIGDIQLSRNPESGGNLYGGLADPNYKWADFITLTYGDNEWPGGIIISPDTAPSLQNEILELSFDGQGYGYIKVEFTNIDSRLDYVYCVMAGYGN